VLNTAVTSLVDPAGFRSLGRATPFAGWRTTGDVVMTIHRGRVVFADKGTVPVSGGSRA